MELARRAEVPIMAMVRPREGGFCYTQVEFDTMLADARALLAAEADGIVFGFLHPDGTNDKYNSTLELAMKIARLLGLHVDEIFFLDD